MIRTGSANLASVFAGLRRAGESFAGGVSPRIIETADDVERLPLVVLPGVGAFGPAMARLRECGLVGPLIERFKSGRPMLVICLGWQLLCEESEESPGVRGLSVVPAKVTRFVASGGRERAGETHVRVPQLGWNRVRVESGEGVAPRVLRDGYAYFANSYKVDPFVPSGVIGGEGGASVLTAEHGTGGSAKFVAGMELAEGRIVCCQLHPELSGEWGLSLLRGWISASTEVASC